MDKTKATEYFETFADNNVRFSPHTIKQMGLIPNQTILKIEYYMLICSPYQLSMKKAILLLILSPDEIKFFKQYEGKTCSLSLVFHKSEGSGSLTLEIKAEIKGIGPVKGRQNVCMIDIQYTQYDPKLIEILGDYIFTYNSLQEYFDKYKDKEIHLDENTIRQLRFNNYMECFINKKKVLAQLLSLSTDRLVFSLPSKQIDVKVGDVFNSKMYFQLYRFIIQGEVKKVEQQPDGNNVIYYSIGFSPELMEILDDYYYRLDKSI